MSGQRFGEHAGSGLAGTCVPLDPDGTGSGDDGATTSGITGLTSDPETTSTVSATTPLTSGVDSSDSEITSLDGSTSTATTMSSTETGPTTATTTTGDDGSTGEPDTCPSYVDDFEDGVIGMEWNVADTVVDEGGSRVFLVTAAEDSYPYSSLEVAFDFTQSWVRARVGMAPGSYSEQLVLAAYPIADPDDLLLWFIEGTQLIARYDDDDVDGFVSIASTPYDPTMHVWLQIRGEGSTVHFELAGDDQVFETIASYEAPFALDQMWAGMWAGNWDLLDADVELSFDHFEICAP